MCQLRWCRNRRDGNSVYAFCLALDEANPALRPSDIKFRPNAGDANEGQRGMSGMFRRALLIIKFTFRSRLRALSVRIGGRGRCMWLYEKGVASFSIAQVWRKVDGNVRKPEVPRMLSCEAILHPFRRNAKQIGCRRISRRWGMVAATSKVRPYLLNSPRSKFRTGFPDQMKLSKNVE
jgi:hypothetical protein